jgi:hypothetical protein
MDEQTVNFSDNLPHKPLKNFTKTEVHRPCGQTDRDVSTRQQLYIGSINVLSQNFIKINKRCKKDFTH